MCGKEGGLCLEDAWSWWGWRSNWGDWRIWWWFGNGSLTKHIVNDVSVHGQEISNGVSGEHLHDRS